MSSTSQDADEDDGDGEDALRLQPWSDQERSQGRCCCVVVSCVVKTPETRLSKFLNENFVLLETRAKLVRVLVLARLYMEEAARGC